MRKEARLHIHATLPPRGLQKISNSQKFQQELEILWGKHATEAPTHMLYHHLTQVEQFSLCIKQKLSFSNKSSLETSKLQKFDQGPYFNLFLAMAFCDTNNLTSSLREGVICGKSQVA